MGCREVVEDLLRGGKEEDTGFVERRTRRTLEGMVSQSVVG